MVFSFIKERWNKWKAEKQRLAEEVDREIWKFYHPSQKIDDIDVMSGKQFEEFLARLFGYMGYTEIRMTSTNDQGGDLICVSPYGVSTVVQAKRWKGSVGNGAVQEVLGAMRHYSCSEGIVVTNSTFTPAAIQLVASGADVTLRDRRWLQTKIKEFLPTSVPEFDRVKFEQIMEGFVELTRQAAKKASSRRKRPPRQFQTFSEMLRFAGQAKGAPLTVKEIKRFAKLNINLMNAEAEVRELESRIEEAQANQRYLNEELARLEEISSQFDDEEEKKYLDQLRAELEKDTD